MSYESVLDELETRLRQGQAHFDSWQQEREYLTAAIQAMRGLISQNRQMSLPLTGGGLPPGKSFRGLTYKEAAQKVFGLVDRPLSAPDVADYLFKSGYAGNRKKIKSNIDGVFKRLRDENIITRIGETTTYVLASKNGNSGHD